MHRAPRGLDVYWWCDDRFGNVTVRLNSEHQRGVNRVEGQPGLQCLNLGRVTFPRHKASESIPVGLLSVRIRLTGFVVHGQ